MNYSFPRENIPEPYVKISWQERRERIPADYGLPESVERGLAHPYIEHLKWVDSMGMKAGDFEIMPQGEIEMLLDLEELCLENTN